MCWRCANITSRFNVGSLRHAAAFCMLAVRWCCSCGMETDGAAPRRAAAAAHGARAACVRGLARSRDQINIAAASRRAALRLASAPRCCYSAAPHARSLAARLRCTLARTLCTAWQTLRAHACSVPARTRCCTLSAPRQRITGNVKRLRDQRRYRRAGISSA